MANKNDLKFYLTGSEPNVIQPSSSQSLGGYPSLSEYSINALLADGMNSETDLLLTTGGINNADAVLVNSELMMVSSISDISEYGDEIINVVRGQFGTEPKYHIGNDTVFKHTKSSLFNGSLSSDNKQYRCIAVKNTSNTDVFYAVKVYIKHKGNNTKSAIKIAIEVPENDILYGSTTQGTTISLTDETLKEVYADDTFAGRLLYIDDVNSLNYNMSRQIASFDSKTGTFTFINSLAFAIESGSTYRVEQPPIQRIKSGRISPIVGTSTVSNWSTANGFENNISLDFSGERPNGDDLLPNEVMYIWLERDLSSNAEKYTNNGLVFTVNYRNS